jgi:hypothetical protein
MAADWTIHVLNNIDFTIEFHQKKWGTPSAIIHFGWEVSMK